MNSLNNLKVFLKDCLVKDKNRIKNIYYRSVEFYENFEFYRLKSKSYTYYRN